MSRQDIIRKIHKNYLKKRLDESSLSRERTERAEEIEIFISNDEPLYKMAQVIIKNLKKKLAKKIFDKKLAIKGFAQLAKIAIKKYEKNFGISLGIPRGDMKKTEEEVADLLLDRYSSELKEFNEKYTDVFNQLNEDNRYSILKSLNDPAESMKVISFIEEL